MKLIHNQKIYDVDKAAPAIPPFIRWRKLRRFKIEYKGNPKGYSRQDWMIRVETSRAFNIWPKRVVAEIREDKIQTMLADGFTVDRIGQLMQLKEVWSE